MNFKVLAIESSCDESAVAVLENEKILSNAVVSQLSHAEFGGIVPENASREHLQNIWAVTEKALSDAKVNLTEISGIAVTSGPGLVGSLLVGLQFAKGLALSLNVPFVGVDHIEGHIFAGFLDGTEIPFPYLSLIVSGGHTMLIRVDNFGDYMLIGTTRDDAIGECYDKVARILGLPYPGGPIIDKLAKGGDGLSYLFPVTKLADATFSYSGLKTAVLYQTKKMSQDEIVNEKENLCASFQRAAIEQIVFQLENALASKMFKAVVIGGGVAANSSLRSVCKMLEKNLKIPFILPDFQFCTDNAAMVGLIGYKKLQNGQVSDLSLDASPNQFIQSISCK